jgi:Ribonuclease G/E
MERVRLRGIYSTALTQLLHRWGFSIVQSSPKIRERFQFDSALEPFDLELRDRPDLQGIVAAGPPDAVEKMTALFQKALPDVTTHRLRLPLHAIYWGLVQSAQRSGYQIDLGCDLGFLPHSQVTRPLRVGEAILVQVGEVAPAGKHVILTTELSLPGQRAVLSSQGSIRVSREIEPESERERLLRFGRRYLPSGWGLIWRTGAYRCAESVLNDEVQQLLSLAECLQDHPEEGIPGRLLTFEATTLFEFPGGTKSRLDELRGEVVPTQPGHHKYKASGLLQAGDREASHLPTHLVTDELCADECTVAFPTAGKTLLIEHVKPDGETIILGRGRVEASHAKTKTIRLRREIQGLGVYDGLRVTKAVGDYALAEFSEGRWEYQTVYYSSDGHAKGVYANVNTPIEIYPDRVRYIDLEIDVTRAPDGRVCIIDQAKLEAAVTAGYLSHALAERAQQVAGQLESDLAKKMSSYA